MAAAAVMAALLALLAITTGDYVGIFKFASTDIKGVAGTKYNRNATFKLVHCKNYIGPTALNCPVPVGIMVTAYDNALADVTISSNLKSTTIIRYPIGNDDPLCNKTGICVVNYRCPPPKHSELEAPKEE